MNKAPSAPSSAAAPGRGEPRAEPREGRPQLGVLHGGCTTGDRCHGLRVGLGHRARRRRRGDGALHQADVVDQLVAEIGVHPFDELAALVLDFQRGGT